MAWTVATEFTFRLSAIVDLLASSYMMPLPFFRRNGPRDLQRYWSARYRGNRWTALQLRWRVFRFDRANWLILRLGDALSRGNRARWDRDRSSFAESSGRL